MANAMSRSPSISGEALDVLMRHDWPGNVRELENVNGGLGLDRLEHLAAALARTCRSQCR